MRPVSWFFSFLLLCYVLVRLVLRARGQIRWLAIRDSLPDPPRMVPAPAHLSSALAALFVDSLALRADLVRARRRLTAVAVKDPDAPLGHVRDANYRRALMESWTHINAWLRTVERLDSASAAELADHHLGSEAITGLRDSLYTKWSSVARARALDPFALDDLIAVQQTLERIELALVDIEHGLVALGDHPYRQRIHRAEPQPEPQPQPQPEPQPQPQPQPQLG